MAGKELDVSQKMKVAPKDCSSEPEGTLRPQDEQAQSDSRTQCVIHLGAITPNERLPS